MSINIPTFASRNLDRLNSTDLNDMFTKVEEFINGGIEKFDLNTKTPWVETEHIVRPEFYGGATPRVLYATGDVHYRIAKDEITDQAVVNNQLVNGAEMKENADIPTVTSQSVLDTSTTMQRTETDGKFVAIPDLSVTAYCHQDRDDSNTFRGVVHACFECFEEPPAKIVEHSGIFDNSPFPRETNQSVGQFKSGLTDFEIETHRCIAGLFQLFVNGEPVKGTIRPIFWNYGGAYAHKTHAIVAKVNLQKGMNDISVRIAPNCDSVINKKQVTFLEYKAANFSNAGTSTTETQQPFRFGQIVIARRNMYVEFAYR